MTAVCDVLFRLSHDDAVSLPPRIVVPGSASDDHCVDSTLFLKDDLAINRHVTLTGSDSRFLCGDVDTEAGGLDVDCFEVWLGA